jgi:hypothetical protein
MKFVVFVMDRRSATWGSEPLNVTHTAQVQIVSGCGVSTRSALQD